MPTPSENAITSMEATEAQLRERISSLRSERRAEALARREAQAETIRQQRLDRMAARLEREQKSVAATRTASPGKPSGSKEAKTKDMWSNALKRAQGDDAAPVQPSAKRDGIDRAKLWRKAIKGE